eukprot:TRINITY_DN2914_c0_g1_i2.p1 TRINITY_DN2914_c0_g1~~TRINITY_DN2914_c0_g1_i2.p1  ORF type:complete len:1117 (-),score=390.23 TRINITY_DN2914_c0_g1_i2:29-3379(-)
MEARLDLQQDFYSPKAIQVVVVPIGEISPFKFQFYLDLFRSCSPVDIQEISNGYSQGPLSNRNWKDAKIHLNFHPVPDRSKDDLVDVWGNFQAHRKTYCVIGIVLCNQFPDLSIAKHQFLNVLRSYPSSITSKCFAFEPMPDQPDLSGGESLVMIPNGDMNRLSFYIRTQIFDMTATLLKTLEDWLSGKREPKEEAAAFISTLLDSQETDAEGISKLKKRKQGRLNKVKGDWCLLAGSPADAVLFYNAAIEQTRSYNDRIWLGGALEGYIASILQENNEQPFPVANPDAPNDEVIQKATEAIQNYTKKKFAPLIAECSFKLARYHIQANRKKEATVLLMDLYDLANDLPLGSKIEVCSMIALLFKEMGYNRKFAFFIRETAVLYHKAHNAGAAHNLLNMIAKHYQLADLDESYASLSRRTKSYFGDMTPYNPNVRRPLKDKTQRDWGYVQKIMLQNLVRTSKGINDPHSLVRFSIFLLKLCSNLLSANAQLQYVAELQAAVQNLPSNGFGQIEADLIGLPRLKKVTPLGISEPHLAPVSTESGRASIWLYTPYQKKSANQLVAWEQNEIVQIRVELANESVFDIEVQSMSLSTSGVAFEAYTSTFVIPAHAQNFEVVLTGKPLGPKGVLIIRGVIMRAYNLVCEFPINENAVGISIKEYQHFVKNPTKTQKTSIANKAQVLNALPLLHVREKTLNGNVIHLVEGQLLTANIEFENVGSIPVDSIKVGLEIKTDINEAAPSMYELGDDMDPFRWNEDLLKKHLPLMPGHRLIFPIEIHGKVGVIGGDFTFTYACESNSEFARNAFLQRPIRVQEGLRVSQFNILSCFPTSFADQKDVKDLYLRNDSCLLVFNVSNKTPNNYLLDCTVLDDPQEKRVTFSKQIASVPNSVKKVCIPLKRFTLNEDNLPKLKELKTQYIKPAELLTPAQEKEVRILYWYKYEVLRRVKIEWLCPVFNTVGILDFLPRMILTRPIIEKVKADIAAFDFVLDGYTEPKETAAGEDNVVQALPASKVFYPIRQFKNVKFVVKNITDQAMPVAIRVQPFQDLENGMRSTSLGGKIAWTGVLDRKIPELKPNETFEFDLSICFLAYGTYHFLVCCEDTRNRNLSCSHVLQLTVF